MAVCFPNTDYFLLLCGVMHLFLAAVCESVRKEKKLYAAYKWVVLFGVLRAVADWTNIVALTDPGMHQIMSASRLFLAAAYGSLLFFAKDVLLSATKKKQEYILLSASAVPFVFLSGVNPAAAFTDVLGLAAITSATTFFLRGGVNKKKGKFSGLFLLGAATYVTGILTSMLLLKIPAGIHLEGIAEIIQGAGAVLTGLAVWKDCNETTWAALATRKADVLFMFKMLSGLGAVLIAGWFFTKAATDYTDRDIRYHLISRAQTIADCLDRDAIAALTGTASDQKTGCYIYLKKQLEELGRLNPDCRFIYIMGRRADKVIFLVDSEIENSKDYSPPGQIYSNPSKALIDTFSSGKPFVEGPLTDSWGTWLSGHAGITGLNLKKGAVVGMDILAANWRSTIGLHRLAPVSITCLASLLLMGFMVSLKRSEAFSLRIAASEERYRALFNSINDGIFMELLSEKGVSGKFAEVNDTACKQLGYPRCELLNMSFADLDCNKIELNDVLSEINEKHQVMFERILAAKDETRLWVEISARIINLQGRQAVIYLVRDITERKNLENQLVQSQKLESLGQLAAGIAHEIFHPVAFVTSNLNALKEYHTDFQQIFAAYGHIEGQIEDMQGNENCCLSLNQLKKLKAKLDPDFVLEDMEKAISESKEGMERIRSIARSLRDFSRMDAEEIALADVNQGIKSTLNILRNEIKYKAKIIANYHDLPLIRCYPQQLNQVFLNILANAAQAIEGQGEIRIDTALLGDALEVRIADTGKGIPESNLKNIFKPFFTTKAAGEGTGLGLSIACRIIARHKGTITVESEMGKGTIFRITLPINGVRAGATYM